ncbi:CCR4-NOT transcription complex [Histoplasma capsulatum var. duboisii H88]|uniref:CCR4-NOT transcription complex n=2 Tax=Ajellomyces capsulatus (strain H88) TaxID=544711 RepID=F0UQY4_AJEC8|nr:CCR4-NOT transcription complex [Histoplasma capsulatum var. duboisii H88]
MTPSVPNTSIQVRNLSYNFADGTVGLTDVSFDLPSGSRTLLIGVTPLRWKSITQPTVQANLPFSASSPANASHPTAPSKSAGVDPFTTGLESVTYLGVEWVLNPIVHTDIDVPTLLASVGGDAYPDRRDQLIQILDIDLNWHMHAVSDGERRRVQLAMGLLRPWTLLLLDEITVDLDLLSRSEFLGFLKRETEERECTIVYATHILDNLSRWPTHLVHMHLGRVRDWGPVEKFQVGRLASPSEDSRLGEVVLEWLKRDLRERGPRPGLPGEGKNIAVEL